MLLLLMPLIASAGYPAKDRVREAGAGQDILVQTPHGVVRMPARSLDDEGGTAGSEWWWLGDTWRDAWAYGTPGRQIAVDGMNDVHFAWYWMGGEAWVHGYADYNCYLSDSDSLLRSYNFSFPVTNQAGRCNVAVLPTGHAVILIPEEFSGQNHFRLSAYIDSLPHAGRFMRSDAYATPSAYVGSPRIDVDIQGRIHVVATGNSSSYQVYYGRGTPYVEDGMVTGIDWEISVDSLMDNDLFPASMNSPSIDIACSRDGDRVVLAWIDDPPGVNIGENVVMRVSEDGGTNWAPPMSVTNIPPIDTNCVVNGGNWRECNADTFRPWRDLSLVFDYNNDLHIAFSARGWYYFDEQGVPGPHETVYGTIWHWSEQWSFFSLIANAHFGLDSGISLGQYNLMCHRPNLSFDTTWNELICAYQQFDQHTYSESGYAIGEYFANYSLDNGRTWHVPTNISNTPGVPNQPDGVNPSERDITIAKYTGDSNIHALYLHDYSAGSAFNGEGEHWTSDVIYMRTPLDDIHTGVQIENLPFRADSTGFPSASDQIAPLRSAFELHPNYPNPFNPSTTLQFDLAKAGDVRLTVFDVLGKEVATLVDGRMSAGVHSVEFEGEKFASGVYFARLSVGDVAMTRKMVLLK